MHLLLHAPVSSSSSISPGSSSVKHFKHLTQPLLPAAAGKIEVRGATVNHLPQVQQTQGKYSENYTLQTNLGIQATWERVLHSTHTGYTPWIHTQQQVRKNEKGFTGENRYKSALYRNRNNTIAPSWSLI